MRVKNIATSYWSLKNSGILKNGELGIRKTEHYGEIGPFHVDHEV